MPSAVVSALTKAVFVWSRDTCCIFIMIIALNSLYLPSWAANGLLGDGGHANGLPEIEESSLVSQLVAWERGGV